MQRICHDVLKELGIKDSPLLEVAMALEKIALNDEYFIEKKLYPNIDFYSGITLNAMGFPVSMFTVLFAGRLDRAVEGDDRQQPEAAASFRANEFRIMRLAKTDVLECFDKQDRSYRLAFLCTRWILDGGGTIYRQGRQYRAREHSHLRGAGRLRFGRSPQASIERGIPTARGAERSVVQVKRVLERGAVVR
jgi:hypothetical protein